MTNASRIAPLEGTHFWFVARDELVLTLLDRVAPGRRRIADIGCGTGMFAARLVAGGHDVVAVDVHEPPQIPARVRFVAAPSDALPFEDESVDVVLLRDVLEHVDDRAALAECRRVLCPGGTLLVAVPTWPSLWGPRDERAGHLRRYRRRGLVRTLQHAGFEVREVRGYAFLLLPAFVVSRLVGRRRGSRQLRSEERLPGSLNRVLLAVTRLEVRAAAFPVPRPPIGSSLIVIAKLP